MAQATATADTCPLSPADQTRNLLIFGACTGLIYLAAPVMYIGVTQGALCNKLGASATVANLPGTAYFLTMFMPVLIAWASPSVARLKRNLVLCFVAIAAILGLVAVTLLSALPDEIKIYSVILQGAVCGAASPTAVALLWELIGRGVAESRRGLTLGIAFGLGPLLAVAGSVGHAALVGESVFPGTVLEHDFQGLDYPDSFVALFGLASPVMLLAALMAGMCVVPRPDQEIVRAPFVQGVFGGIGEFVRDPVLRFGAIVTILLYLGNNISTNLNLYSQVALGDDPDKFAGQQNAMRFAFKFVAGTLLGWILTRTNPRAGIFVTGALYIGALIWAMFATGTTYLITFGIYGAGELVGVYAPNYIMSASRKTHLRQNMALMQLIMVPTAPAGALFGSIAQTYALVFSPAAGFRLSFALCAALMAVGLLIAVCFLPPRPQRPDS